jgi:hypothetical protein
LSELDFLIRLASASFGLLSGIVLVVVVVGPGVVLLSSSVVLLVVGVENSALNGCEYSVEKYGELVRLALK